MRRRRGRIDYAPRPLIVAPSTRYYEIVVNHVYTRLKSLLGDPPKRLREYLDMIQVLAGNRDLEHELKEAQTMLTRIDMTRTANYQLG